MRSRLELFYNQAKRIARIQQSSKRKLYTEGIYKYRNDYYNNVVFPGHSLYRETWPYPPRNMITSKIGDIGFKLFWTYMWYQLFTHPEALIGHWKEPDPTRWTDEQLGIPPDEEGSYADWLKKQSKQD